MPMMTVVFVGETLTPFVLGEGEVLQVSEHDNLLRVCVLLPNGSEVFLGEQPVDAYVPAGLDPPVMHLVSVLGKREVPEGGVRLYQRPRTVQRRRWFFNGPISDN